MEVAGVGIIVLFAWFATAFIQKVTPFALLARMILWLSAACYALEDFALAGYERVTSRRHEYLERARKEL